MPPRYPIDDSQLEILVLKIKYTRVLTSELEGRYLSHTALCDVLDSAELWVKWVVNALIDNYGLRNGHKTRN